jgi:subtilisin family serine protease
MKKFLFGSLILGGIALTAQVDESHPENWFNMNPENQSVNGVGTDKAYKELLAGKQGSEIIVAVIDGGVDYFHEDLKRVMWVNKAEIPGNGIDDDKNGYVDDIHGWNFIGGMKDGKPTHVDGDNLEVTRTYASLLPKYGRFSKEKGVAKDNREEYKLFKKAEKSFKESRDRAFETMIILTASKKNLDSKAEDLRKALNVEEITAESIKGFETEDEKLKQMVASYSRLFNYIDYINSQLNYYYNPLIDTREIVGDDYTDFENRDYGNNDIKGPDASHGTHVAGIIAADRTNDIGMNGIADNVKIMGIRVVPGGDERDKDIANGVYYAVDNGAKIINMSFGKKYSPYKSYVDKAFKYAESKGVLLLAAAGNNGENLEEIIHYPTDKMKDEEHVFSTWMQIGASDVGKTRDEFTASFSNYGNETVDVFAPGVQIYATWPENEYKSISGTSMATPVVSGVAALIWSYYPHLTALQVKEIILKSAIDHADKKINLPGSNGQDKKGNPTVKYVKFSKLSLTGGIVNVYEALKLAETYKK